MKENNIPRQIQEKFRNLINDSKKRGLIKPHTEAFREFPVEKEKHNGKKKYFKN